MPADTPPEKLSRTPAPETSHSSHLKPLRIRGSMAAWALAGVLASGLGLVLITGLSRTPWLFLLYPVFIGMLLASLVALALHLLHKF